MATKAKHLQFVSGVGVTVFWLSNLVWDYVSFLIPACGMLLTLLAFQEEGFIEPETQGTDAGSGCVAGREAQTQVGKHRGI